MTGKRFREAAVGASCVRWREGCSPGAALLNQLIKGFSRQGRPHTLRASSALRPARGEDRWYHVDLRPVHEERGFFILRRICNERGT